MSGCALAQSSVVYLITDRLAIELIFIDSTLWFLLHITVCVWMGVCELKTLCIYFFQAYSYLTLGFHPLDFSAEGQSDP